MYLFIIFAPLINSNEMKSLLFALTLCFLSFQTGVAQNWDARTASKLNGWHIHGVSRGLSYSGLILPVGIPSAMGIYALVKKDEPLLKEAVFIGTSVIEAVGLTYGLKHTFNRERPYIAHPDLIHLVGPVENTPSFPSGHTAAAFSLATSLSIAYPKWYIIAPSSVWACGVGLARINQGVHYPSDVLVGAAIGMGCAFLNVYVNKWLNQLLFE